MHRLYKNNYKSGCCDKKKRIMLYLCYNSPLSATQPVNVDRKHHSKQYTQVLARIAETLHVNTELLNKIIKTGYMPQAFNSEYGLPNGYVYHLDTLSDFPCLLSAMKSDGVWCSLCDEAEALAVDGAPRKHAGRLKRVNERKKALEQLHSCVALAIKTASEIAS